MNEVFVLKSTYDKTAYEALAEASWQMFRKPKLQTQAYPVLLALIALVAVTMIYNRGSYGTPLLVGGIVFILFPAAAIPLSGLSARAKMRSTAIKDAKSRGEYPAEIQFIFRPEGITSTVGGHSAMMKYTQVSYFAALGDWRFVFFGQMAYIFHRSSFEKEGELKHFEEYITAKCSLSMVTLKGTGPKR